MGFTSLVHHLWSKEWGFGGPKVSHALGGLGGSPVSGGEGRTLPKAVSRMQRAAGWFQPFLFCWPTVLSKALYCCTAEKPLCWEPSTSVLTFPPTLRRGTVNLLDYLSKGAVEDFAQYMNDTRAWLQWKKSSTEVLELMRNKGNFHALQWKYKIVHVRFGKKKASFL